MGGEVRGRGRVICRKCYVRLRGVFGLALVWDASGNLPFDETLVFGGSVVVGARERGGAEVV